MYYCPRIQILLYQYNIEKKNIIYLMSQKDKKNFKMELIAALNSAQQYAAQNIKLKDHIKQYETFMDEQKQKHENEKLQLEGIIAAIQSAYNNEDNKYEQLQNIHKELEDQFLQMNKKYENLIEQMKKNTEMMAFEQLGVIAQKVKKSESYCSEQEKSLYVIYNTLFEWLQKISKDQDKQEINQPEQKDSLESKIDDKLMEVENFIKKLKQLNLDQEIAEKHTKLINDFKVQIINLKKNLTTFQKLQSDLDQTKKESKMFEEAKEQIYQELQKKNLKGKEVMEKHKREIQVLKEKQLQEQNEIVEKLRLEISQSQDLLVNEQNSAQQLQEQLVNLKQQLQNQKNNESQIAQQRLPSQPEEDDSKFSKLNVELQKELSEKSNKIDELQKLVEHLTSQSKQYQIENVKIEVYKRTLISVNKRQQYIRHLIQSFFADLQRNQVKVKA